VPNGQPITETCHLSHQRASIRRPGGGEEYGAFKTNGVIAPKVQWKAFFRSRTVLGIGRISGPEYACLVLGGDRVRRNLLRRVGRKE
jgi:hypothetical protein